MKTIEPDQERVIANKNDENSWKTKFLVDFRADRLADLAAPGPAALGARSRLWRDDDCRCDRWLWLEFVRRLRGPYGVHVQPELGRSLDAPAAATEWQHDRNVYG